MSDFDLQGLVQVGISTDRPAHKNIIREAVREITLLRVEVERLRVRCAEMESQLHRYPAGVKAHILRKQAEAVEACEQEFQGSLYVQMTLSQCAERLRQQADEAEKAGGGNG